MSVTVNDVFERAMALCDYIDSEGTVIENEFTAQLAKRTPALCDAAQRELVYYIDLIKSEELDFSVQQAYPVPEDYIATASVIPNNAGIEIIKGVAIISRGFTGTALINYLTLPGPITDENSRFSYSDNDILSTVPYFLAAAFMKEENPSLSAEFTEKFERARSRLRAVKSQSFFEEITDTVGTECEANGSF